MIQGVGPEFKHQYCKKKKRPDGPPEFSLMILFMFQKAKAREVKCLS
jgi:hypothetical protein